MDNIDIIYKQVGFVEWRKGRKELRVDLKIIGLRSCVDGVLSIW